MYGQVHSAPDLKLTSTERSSRSRDLDCLLHREVIQFVPVCEHDVPDPGRVKRARGQIANEQPVVRINIGLSNNDVSNYGPQQRAAPQAASREHYSRCKTLSLFLLLAREIVIEDIMRAIWPAIKGEVHRLEFQYASHV